MRASEIPRHMVRTADEKFAKQEFSIWVFLIIVISTVEALRAEMMELVSDELLQGACAIPKLKYYLKKQKTKT